MNAFTICLLGKLWVNCLKSLKKLSIYLPGKTPSAPSVMVTGMLQCRLLDWLGINTTHTESSDGESAVGEEENTLPIQVEALPPYIMRCRMAVGRMTTIPHHLRDHVVLDPLGTYKRSSYFLGQRRGVPSVDTGGKGWCTQQVHCKYITRKWTKYPPKTDLVHCKHIQNFPSQFHCSVPSAGNAHTGGKGALIQRIHCDFIVIS